MDNSDSDTDSDSSNDGGGDILSSCNIFKEKKKKNNETFYFRRIETISLSSQQFQVIFKYNYDNEVEITSSILLDTSGYDMNLIHSPTFSKILLSIGMCVLTWYWMGFATPCIRIEEGAHHGLICTPMKQFWENFLQNILLEFLFVNRERGLNSIFPLKFIVDGLRADEMYIEDKEENISTEECGKGLTSVNPSKLIIPLGGGKDSIVAWHLATTKMKNQIEPEIEPLLVYVADGLYEFEGNWRLPKIVEKMGCSVDIVRHQFYCEKFEKNARSYLSPVGHPWAALVLFDSVLISFMKGHPHHIYEISLGFEKSADEGNGVYVNGLEVNHQYDKSSQFVQLAQKYISCHISRFIRIHSELSNLHEIEIASIFCSEPALKPFIPLFLSCNEPLECTRWCAKCEKCCFIFLILSAWMEPTQVWAIFGENLLAKESLVEVFIALVGGVTSHYRNHVNGQKVFECVGTFREGIAAVHLATIQYQKMNMNLDLEIDAIKSPCAQKQPSFTLPFCLLQLIKYCEIELENGLPLILDSDEVLELYGCKHK